MADIDRHVDVTISKDTATVSRVGFGTPAMLTFHTKFPELAREFGDLDEVQAPGGPFPTTSREVAIATAMFAQNPKPSKIAILRRATAPTRDVDLTPITDAVAGKPFALFLYQITIDDFEGQKETFDFTTDVTPTEAEIIAAFETAINAGTVNVTATDNVTFLTIEKSATPGGGAAPGVPFGLEVDRTLFTQIDNTVDPGITADLAAARLVNDDWYGLVSDASGEDEITSLGTAVEALLKIYGAESADDNVLTSAVDDIGTVLAAANLDRTFLITYRRPHISPSGAWQGKKLPSDPGSTTWKFDTLATIAVEDFLSSELTFLDSKNVNYYTLVAGLAITAEATMASGEFIDITRGIDALTARMKENVFRALKVNPKVPITKAGIQIVVNEVEGTIRAFQPTPSRPGALIALEPPPVVTFPDPSDININDRASRLLPLITFTATLAGAVHKTEIRGRVTV